jgi:hypothetical protein
MQDDIMERGPAELRHGIRGAASGRNQFEVEFIIGPSAISFQPPAAIITDGI